MSKRKGRTMGQILDIGFGRKRVKILKLRK